MKTINLIALFVGAALFTGVGATSLMAEESMKCGAGKCGTSMPKAQGNKCGGSDKNTSGKCGGEKKTSGKCGSEKKAPVKGKCGTGKCG